tara:strand:- start:6786 stop:6980 length:195 start_codon:yes stop_codon:yes gene_type:complete
MTKHKHTKSVLKNSIAQEGIGYDDHELDEFQQSIIDDEYQAQLHELAMNIIKNYTTKHNGTKHS